MKNEELYSALLSGKGYEIQIDQAIEEFAEAITTIQHWKRGRCSFKQVITELTHADQMIKQMRFIASINIENEPSYNYWKNEQQKTHRRLLKLVRDL